MRIGRLGERITIESYTSTQDAYGQEVKAWTPFATLWAEVRTPSASEQFNSGADREIARIDYRIKIRFRSDISNRMRIDWRGKKLDITAQTDPDGNRRELILGCTEHESQ
jgi:SPP1 family predicted phage head-tail adaptor